MQPYSTNDANKEYESNFDGFSSEGIQKRE